MTTPRTIHLIPPRISPGHIDQKITCIRAHRERLFRVEPELCGNKTIYHNYGQGGAGWTFLFGCVQTSLDQFRHGNHGKQPICVIGAGCYGLLTAIMLARSGYSVRIVAKQQGNDVSSYKAAGFFFPRPRKVSTPNECQVFEAKGIASYTTYQQIIHGTHPFLTRGAVLLPGYFAPDNDPGFAPYIERGLMPPPQPVVVDFGNGKQYHLLEYQTLFMNAHELMQQLQQEARSLGITITNQHVVSFDEPDESVIFNCAGLGAKQLAHDPRMVPVQGHLITLKDQPPAQHLQYLINVKVTQNTAGRLRDELIYYAPKQAGILGITFLRGQESETSNSHEFDRLLTRCQDFFGAPQ